MAEFDVVIPWQIHRQIVPHSQHFAVVMGHEPVEWLTVIEKVPPEGVIVLHLTKMSFFNGRRNAMGTLQNLENGQRRQNKEFFQHACFVPCSNVNLRCNSLLEHEVRKIAAFIMQAKAHEFRQKHAMTDDTDPINGRNYVAPRRGRDKDGCLHAIVNSTRLSYTEAGDYFERWLVLNESLVQQLDWVISQEPFFTYFH